MGQTTDERSIFSTDERHADQNLHDPQRICCVCLATMLPSSPGTHLALVGRMTAKSLADRVSALEAKVGSKTIEEQFREQAELIDRLFIYRFDEMDKRWDAKLDAKLSGLEEKLETRLDTKLEPIRNDLATVKDAVKVILARLT